jgi:hypothetical protein
MGDLIFLIIMLAAILYSLFEKFVKPKSDEEGPSLDERLEEAIRRSKNKPAGRQERSRPPVAPTPAERGASRPAPRPPTPRPAPPTARMPTEFPRTARREIPTPPAPEPPRTFPSARPASRPATARPAPVPEFVGTTMQKLQTTKAYETAARGVENAATERGRMTDPGSPGSRKRRGREFTQRQLRDLIVFGEALQRPRRLREHPIYHRISRI